MSRIEQVICDHCRVRHCTVGMLSEYGWVVRDGRDLCDVCAMPWMHEAKEFLAREEWRRGEMGLQKLLTEAYHKGRADEFELQVKIGAAKMPSTEEHW